MSHLAPNIILRLVVPVLFISTMSLAGTNHYRWLDDRGNWVHSDRPPPKGIDYEVVSTGSELKRVVASEEGAVPAEITPRVGNEFTPIDTRAQPDKKPEQCKRARENLESLSSSLQIRIRDKNGQYRYLTDGEREAERQKALSTIDVHCD